MDSTIDVNVMIRSLFPGREELFERIYRSDASFRTLCRDYRTCHATLERLRHEASDDARGRRREYAGLLEDLAAEIRRWPDDHPPATPI